MKRVIALFGAIALGLAVSATPFVSKAFLIQKPSSYIGPGDIVPFTAWYGVRGYSAAKAASGTTKMLRMRGVSSGELCDVLVSSSGGIGLTTSCTGASGGLTLVAFCSASGGCRVRTWYDQISGNACTAGTTCDLIQTTNNNQFGIGSITNIANTYLTPVGGNENLTSANNFTPSAALISVSVVAQRVGFFTSSGRLISGAGVTNGIECNTVANQWKLVGGATSFAVTASDSAWHSGNGVINGVSSVLMINGTNTTGTATASTTGAAPNTGLAAVGCTYQIREAGFINNYALSSGERTSLDTNQRTYWGF